MGRLKYLCKKVFTWNYKDAYARAKILKKKYGGNAFLIWCDMVMCGALYGAGYIDYDEFEFNLLNRKQRKTYLTAELNNRIVKKYNAPNYRYLFKDKIEFNRLFKDYIKRDFLSIRDNDATVKEFKAFSLKHKKIVAKAVDAMHGLGIDFYDVDETTNFEELYNKLRENKQYLIEECIVQHSEMAKLYKGSVNSLRVITFLTDDGKVVILRAVLKIGNKEGIDNCRNGGMYTFLDDNGVVLLPAFDENNNIYEKHPKSGTEIVGFKVPYYKEIQELVSKAGKVVPEIRYVGWDIAITEKGPIIIEGNEYSGIFQMKASMNPTKIGDLPRFRKYMDI